MAVRISVGRGSHWPRWLSAAAAGLRARVRRAPPATRPRVAAGRHRGSEGGPTWPRLSWSTGQPPASGPHYGIWPVTASIRRRCPAVLVHNLEHGRSSCSTTPAPSAAVAELRQLWRPAEDPLRTPTRPAQPDPLLPAVAAVAAFHVLARSLDPRGAAFSDSYRGGAGGRLHGRGIPVTDAGGVSIPARAIPGESRRSAGGVTWATAPAARGDSFKSSRLFGCRRAP